MAEARRYMIRERIEEAGATMNKPVVTLAVTVLSAVACGATFLFALARQFALVEIAASIVCADRGAEKYCGLKEAPLPPDFEGGGAVGGA
jgi:hypothetical protein